MIVWIVLELILHTINHHGEEGIVELGDDRIGESNNKQQQTQMYIELRIDQKKRRK